MPGATPDTMSKGHLVAGNETPPSPSASGRPEGMTAVSRLGDWLLRFALKIVGRSYGSILA